MRKNSPETKVADLATSTLPTVASIPARYHRTAQCLACRIITAILSQNVLSQRQRNKRQVQRQHVAAARVQLHAMQKRSRSSSSELRRDLPSLSREVAGLGPRANRQSEV
jgi:hypothetical protein